MLKMIAVLSSVQCQGSQGPGQASAGDSVKSVEGFQVRLKACGRLKVEMCCITYILCYLHPSLYICKHRVYNILHKILLNRLPTT